MQKSFILALAGVVLGAVPALADGYAREHNFRYANAMGADGVDWTGLYSGMHSGGVSGKTNFIRTGQVAIPTGPGSLCSVYPSFCAGLQAYRNADIGSGTVHTVDIEGFHVGPHIGYQKQFGHLVLGADLGFSVGGGEGEKDCNGGPGVAAALGAHPNILGWSARCRTQYKYSTNLRARIGYATGNWLFYGMAGLVRARVDSDVQFTETFAGGSLTIGERSVQYPNGYIFGAGLEYQDSRGMRWGLSYTHILLEDVNVVVKDALGGGSRSRYTNDPDVLGASLKVPLQQQATQTADAGPPAAQQTAQAAQPAAQAQQQRPAAQQQQQRPAAQPAAQRPATQPATAPAAAQTPVQGAPAEPDTPTPTGKPKK